VEMAPGAFGLRIVSRAGVPGLDRRGGVAGRRRAVHGLAEDGEIDRRLAGGGLSLIGADGEGETRVEYHERSGGGLLIRTASFGEHLLLEGGRTVLSSVAAVEPELWQRYVLGQVLPLTASVQGLEVFHASAVALEGGVLVLAGGSGAGKSSLAAALIASGEGAFFADDVVALDATAFGLTAYPGTTLMSIPRDLDPELRAALPTGQPWVADERKEIASVRGERRPQPVLAFLRLTPEEGNRGMRFEPCLPDRLMATTFDGVSRTPERMRRLLRVAALLAAGGRAEELRYPLDSDPRALAVAIRERLGAGVGLA
jgi:hypothetical protein